MTSPAPVKPTETARPTPGPWRARDTRDYAEIVAPDGTIVAMVGREIDVGPIAEAGTVLHETGLSPRQLADQRAELLAACKGFILGCPSKLNLANLVGEDVVREAVAAIARAEGRS